MIEETHDPSIVSFIPSANKVGHPFPIQNLPFAIAQGKGVVVRIGDKLVSCRGLVERKLIGTSDEAIAQALSADNLLQLMRLSKKSRKLIRKELFSLLRDENDNAKKQLQETELVSDVHDAQLTLPHQIPNYTDFYASIDHARNVGKLFRPDNPLLPNYAWNPIAYHGRASSVVVSGHKLVRPQGQRRDGDGAVFGPTTQLDYEVELGFYIAEGNELGSPISISESVDKLFGCCILNDWSARDIQSWESQPLGPFLGKNFLTTISPWVITAEALEPFRVPVRAKEEGAPDTLSYLYSGENQTRGAIDVRLEVSLRTGEMKRGGSEFVKLSTTFSRNLYWTPAQMITHHSVNGCNLCPGDLIGSGTVSGSGEDERGCLLELTERGKKNLKFPEPRTFLEDYDEVMMTGWCEREGYRSIGFGECVGQVVP